MSTDVRGPSRVSALIPGMIDHRRVRHEQDNDLSAAPSGKLREQFRYVHAKLLGCPNRQEVPSHMC